MTSPLRRRAGIELIHAGSWSAMTGSWNPTPADIAAAVEAQSCPAIRKPVIKLGHTDGRFLGDGEPALGWFENLRAPTPRTLVGDQVTLPWLDSVQAAAYPSRSIEGNYNHRCSEGHVHPFVITAVALLGVTPPAVQTLRNLNDLQELVGVAAGTDVPEGAQPVQVTVMAAGEEEPAHTGAMVALLPSAEDADRLAVDGGLAPEELHCTLMYLGEADQIPTKVRARLVDEINRSVAGFPAVDAAGFSIAAFNPISAEPCIVLGISGQMCDDIHDLVEYVVLDTAANTMLDLPDQHAPWQPHVTLAYTGELTRIVGLADLTGPIRFDRVRIMFGGEATDIPLTGSAWAAPHVDAAEPVAAADGKNEVDRNQLKRYWTTGKGLAKWKTKPHPWTALYRHLKHYMNDELAKRTASQWFKDVFGYWPGSRKGMNPVGPG